MKRLITTIFVIALLIKLFVACSKIESSDLVSEENSYLSDTIMMEQNIYVMEKINSYNPEIDQQVPPDIYILYDDKRIMANKLLYEWDYSKDSFDKKAIKMDNFKSEDYYNSLPSMISLSSNYLIQYELEMKPISIQIGLSDTINDQIYFDFVTDTSHNLNDLTNSTKYMFFNITYQKGDVLYFIKIDSSEINKLL